MLTKSLIFSVALLLLITACGTTTPSTVRIGFIGPLTGDAAVLGVPIMQGAKLAAEEINAGGGVNGKLIEFFAEDGKCKGTDAATAFLKLRDVSKIDAVVVTCSPELLAIAPLAAPNILVLSPSATAPSITEAGSHVFRLSPSDALQGKVGAKLIKEHGYKKVGILYVNHDYGAGLNQVITEELGSMVVASEVFEPDAKDYRTQLMKMRGVDVLYLAAFPKDVTLIMRQMRELNMSMLVYASEAAKDPTILGDAEGIIITVPSAKGSTYETFAHAYEKRFGVPPNVFSGEAYDTLKVIAKAAANNPDNLVAGMQQVARYDGVAGSVTFDANGDVEKPYDLFTVKNGEFMQLS